jgi:hypothetical protein
MACARILVRQFGSALWISLRRSRSSSVSGATNLVAVLMPGILPENFCLATYVLGVHDLEKSSRFFIDLGFIVILEPPGWVFVEKDNCMIMIGECPGAVSPRDLGDHSYFGYLRVDDADGYYQDLLTKEVKINSPIENKPWGMRESGVESPEGHRITIGQWVG